MSPIVSSALGQKQVPTIKCQLRLGVGRDELGRHSQLGVMCNSWIKATDSGRPPSCDFSVVAHSALEHFVFFLERVSWFRHAEWSVPGCWLIRCMSAPSYQRGSNQEWPPIHLPTRLA